MGKFEISKRKNGEFQFNLKATNGEVILSSEGYAAKDNCQKGIASVQKNATLEKSYEKKTAKNGNPFFNLKAANGQVVGTSELYSSEAARDKGIESVKRNAPDAKTIDLTYAV